MKKEIINAYTELNDPVVQRERFEQQAKVSDQYTPTSFISCILMQSFQYISIYWPFNISVDNLHTIDECAPAFSCAHSQNYLFTLLSLVESSMDLPINGRPIIISKHLDL